MPRAFLKKKNKGGHKTYTCTHPGCGKPILAGEEYYTWKFNRGGRYFQHAEHGYPKRSQLSNSKMAEVWDAVDEADLSQCMSVEDVEAVLADVAQAAYSVASEYESSADNIEQSFPSGNPTSQACRDTANELESWAGEIESWSPDEFDPSGIAPDDMTEAAQDWFEGVRESAQDILNNQPEYQG